VRVGVVILTVLATIVTSGVTVERPRPLRVVTFNLLHGGPSSGLVGDGESLEARLALTTTDLRGLTPDVVGLQEASVGRGRGNVAARLAAALDMHYVHGPATTRVLPIPFVNRLLVRVMNFAEGPAVLSRYPITDWEVYDLPRCAKRLDARVLVRAEIATPWGPLTAFSTHLGRDDCQVARVAEIVRERAARGPTIVMGDFNASEATPAITHLHDAGLIDAFRAANPAAPGYTVWQRPGAPERTVGRRVDYIFVAGVPAERTVACASRVVLDTPRRDVDTGVLWPSDHYGVLAELNLFGIKCAP
jgi:endonuclease/exonuclease/phosphatase family metal-dependent hydrolase